MVRSTLILGAFLMALADGPLVSAQQAGSLGSVTVSAKVSYDASKGVYAYGYVIANPASSTAGVDEFDVDITRPPATIALDTVGLAFADTTTANMVRRAYTFLYGNVTSVSFSGIPAAWNANLSMNKTASWFTSRSHVINPNSSLAGFVMPSKGTPVIRSSTVVPFFSVEQYPGMDSLSSDAADSLASYLDSLRSVLPKTVQTIGPSNPPSPFDSLKFLDTLKSYTTRSRSLGWIGDQTTTAKYTTFCDSAKAQLQRGDVRKTRASLDSATANAQRDSGNVLTSEAYALIFFNAKFLLSRLPIPPPQYTLTVSISGGGTVTRSPNQALYDSATTVTLTATPSANYRFSGWSGAATGSTNPLGVTMSGAKSITATFVRTFQITVQTNPSGRTDSVDGVAYTATQVFTWDSASTHRLATITPQGAGTGVQYAWANWSDGAAISHTVSAGSAVTYTANFTKQYHDTVKTNPAGRSFSIDGSSYSAQQVVWWDSGSTHTIATTSPQTSTWGGQYTWLSWSDAGVISHSVTATQAVNLTANFNYTVSSPLISAWNMVSVPVVVSNFAKSALYPSGGSAFAFGPSGYAVTSTLANGPAYWVKFGTNPPAVSYTGVWIDSLRDSVITNWNMIGSVSHDVPISQIRYDGTTKVSNYFGYNGGYFVADTIKVGKGYWVKVSQAGKIVIGASATPGSPPIQEPPPPSPGSPATPTLLSPSNGATGQSPSPTLTWNASDSASSYRSQVSTDQNFGTIVFDQAGLTSTSVQAGPLSYSTIYYWRVNASNSYGTSYWSSTRSFTTQAPPPAAPATPTLISPANGSTDQDISPTLMWNASGGATSYELQVSASSSFSPLAYDNATLTTTSQQVSGLAYSTTYYWRVNAAGPGGTSSWSDTWYFTTQSAPPPPCDCCTPSIAALDQFTVTDASGRGQSVFVNNAGRKLALGVPDFEMPPEPMGGAFSARFQSNRFVENVLPAQSRTTIPIVVKNATLPVTISWNILPKSKIQYWLTDPGSGQVRQLAPGSGKIQINKSGNATVLIRAQAIQPCTY